MLRRLSLILALIAGFALPTPAPANEEDQAFLARLLSDTLSEAGRDVGIFGFQGALSSRATISTITIADGDGIWLTLRGVVLDWNRSALFARRLEVNELTAREIIIERAPDTGPGTPSTEARSFGLPELPVSVRIGLVSAERVHLGEALFGAAAEVSLEGSAQLADGAGTAKLEIVRIDGEDGRLSLDGDFSNLTQVLRLDLFVSEAADGIAANLIGIPGTPSIDLSIAGDGPLDDFVADIRLATDATDRLTGQVALISEAPEEGAIAGARRFRADIGGDIAPLFAPEFRAFFGNEIRLVTEGAQLPDGQLELSTFDLRANAIALSGNVMIGADGLPGLIRLDGEISGQDGNPVLLPLSGPRTSIENARLSLDFDAERGEDWDAEISALGVVRPDMRIERLALSGSGQITDSAGVAGFAADFLFAAEGLAPVDQDIARALGRQVEGHARLNWQEGDEIRIPSFGLVGSDYGLEGAASIRGQTVQGHVEARLDALERFSGLAGRPLSGALTGRISGNTEILSGAFDIDAQLLGRDLTLDQEELDRVLAGVSSIRARARRDETGTFIDSLEVSAQQLRAQLSGSLSSAGSLIDADLDFADLGILGADYGGALRAEGRFRDSEGLQGFTFTATGIDLAVGQAELDRLLRGRSEVSLEAGRMNGVINLNELRIGAGTMTARIAGRIEDGANDLTGQIDFSDLATLGNGYGGALSGEGRFFDANGRQLLTATATGQDLSTGQAELDNLLRGQSTVIVEAARSGSVIDVNRFSLQASTLLAQITGRIEEGANDLTGQVDFTSLAALGGSYGGAISAEGRFFDADGRENLTLTATGQDLAVGQAELDSLLRGRSTVALDAAREGNVIDLRRFSLEAGALTTSLAGRIEEGASDLVARLAMTDLGALGRRFGGRLEAEAHLREEGALRRLTLTADGQDLSIGVPQIDPITRGTSRLTLEGTQQGDRFRLDALRFASPQLTADANATVEGDSRLLELSARLANLGLIVPELAGPMTFGGRITEGPDSDYQLDLSGSGPGGIEARVTGLMARDLTSNLTIAGTTNLALVNPFIDPINVQGPAQFDLRMVGQPGLDALSGTLSASGARIVAPGQGVTLEALNATASLSGGRLQMDADGSVQGGGQLGLAGTIDLVPGVLPANLTLTLQSARVTDRNIFETRVSGNLNITGGLAGRQGRIAGAVSLEDTEIRIPSTGLGSGAFIPNLQHVNESAASRATRLAARLTDNAGDANGRQRNSFALDITLSSPNRVFVRGRGVDAELGGSLRLTGTTLNVIPSGQFSLLRGRLDLLGRRFILSDGLARLQGRFVPFLRLTATTSTDGITASIVVEGEADALQIRFISTPELPEEEVVSRLLFGRGLERLSPFQAAQLASAVATLAGRGGEGIVGNLRRSFGLDDLDISTGEDGTAALRVGRYLTENIYTDVTVDAEGRSEVSINLDVSPSVTVRGRTDSEGRSGIGVFFERDY